MHNIVADAPTELALAAGIICTMPLGRRLFDICKDAQKRCICTPCLLKVALHALALVLQQCNIWHWFCSSAMFGERRINIDGIWLNTCTMGCLSTLVACSARACRTAAAVCR
jgi:hypothetical protein